VRRRSFIAGLSLVATSAVSFDAVGQMRAKRHRIGFITGVPKEGAASWLARFIEGMRELGYREGVNFDVEPRYGQGDMATLPALAKELVRLYPDIILAGHTTAALAAKRATSTIPIVCPLLGADLAKLGLAASQARPNENVTGVLYYVEGLPGKLLEIALEIVPGATKFGLLADLGGVANAALEHDVKVASTGSAAQIISIGVHGLDEIEPAFNSLVKDRIAAVIVPSAPTLSSARDLIARLASAAGIPSVFSSREYVDAGGLISYGVSFRESYHKAATYVDKILRGATPADLPLEFPTKLELVVNLKTARAISVTIPPAMLARADEVIE
jgi:putative tryptophan/tyrosine transport system substrate-binding protein